MALHNGIFNPDDLVKCYQLPSLAKVMEGNKVMLKSGGPRMTVSECIGTDAAVCQWLNADGKLSSLEFKLIMLTCYGAE